MTTTTSELIRERQTSLVEGVTPFILSADTFCDHPHHGDFRVWAEDNTTACLRRFRITDLMTYEPPLVSCYQQEEARTTFEVVVAYPVDHRYNDGEHNGLSIVIETDRRQIDNEIGLLADGKRNAGHSLASLESSDIERGDDVWFLVLEYEIIYLQDSIFSSIAVGTPGSLEDIVTSSDPMQSLINGMGASVLPSFMWTGSGNASGTAQEVGGSGFDLTEDDSSTLVYGVFDAVLGTPDNTQHEETNNFDSMLYDGPGLAVGTSSFCLLQILRYEDIGSTLYSASRYDSGLGFRNFHLTNSSRFFTVATPGGTFQVSVPGAPSTEVMQVDLCQRVTSEAVVRLTTRDGTAQATESGTIQSADSPGQQFTMGRPPLVGTGSFRGKWGLIALWVGPQSEQITSNMRALLQETIG